MIDSIFKQIRSILITKYPNIVTTDTPYYKMHEALYDNYENVPYVNPYTGDTIVDLEDTVANTKLQLKEALKHKDITYCLIDNKLVYLKDAKLKQYPNFFNELGNKTKLTPHLLLHETEFYSKQFIYFKLVDNYGNVLKGDYLGDSSNPKVHITGDLELTIDPSTGICKTSAITESGTFTITYDGKNVEGDISYNRFNESVDITIIDDPCVLYCPQTVKNITYHTSQKFRNWSSVSYNTLGTFNSVSCYNIYNYSSNNLPYMPKGLKLSNFKLITELPSDTSKYNLTGDVDAVFTDMNYSYGSGIIGATFETAEKSYGKTTPYQVLFHNIDSPSGYYGASDGTAPTKKSSHICKYFGDDKSAVGNIFNSSFYVELRWGRNNGKVTCSQLELKGFSLKIYYRPTQTPMT